MRKQKFMDNKFNLNHLIYNMEKATQNLYNTCFLPPTKKKKKNSSLPTCREENENQCGQVLYKATLFTWGMPKNLIIYKHKGIIDSFALLQINHSPKKTTLLTIHSKVAPACWKEYSYMPTPKTTFAHTTGSYFLLLISYHLQPG